MLHLTDQNQHSSAHKTIKLSANTRAEPVVRTLKSTLVNYKDSISHTKNNEPIQNRSMNLEKRDSGLESSSQKWDKVIAHQKEVNNNWNR